MDRFDSFSPGQREQLQREFDSIVKRVILIAAVLVVGGSIGFGFALKGIHDASDRGDRASARAASVNRHLIHDANVRAAESKKQAALSAQTAYAACRRQQEGVIVSREFFALLRPALDAHNDPRLVDKLFHDIAAQHTFELPKCVKPPKDS